MSGSASSHASTASATDAASALALTPYPAIDLKDGFCVRLQQGDMLRATVFNRDPVAQAASFQQAGFPWLHLVDLNGAFAGKPVNRDAVLGIVRQVSVPVQLGGGIRDLATIEQWLDAGIHRVILGTVAVKNPALVREACRVFPGRIAVGIDARGGQVAVEGWAESSSMPAMNLARLFEDTGVSAIIYTDIARDGILTGVNVEETVALARAVRIPVIASGGVASVADLHALRPHVSSGVAGVIIGRALYDGKIQPAEALAACR